MAGVSLTLRADTFAEAHVADYDDAWMYACAQHAETVFDVGANIGQSTLLMLTTGHVKQIVLVDANASALAVAADNLIRNRLSAACRFVPAFAGDQLDSAVEFWTVGTGAAGSMYKGHATTAARTGNVTKVPTVTLDHLCAQYGVVPDLVKIDVEGAEHKVLCGSTVCASHQRTRFFIEMHSPPELPMIENARRVLEWASSVDYAAWYLSDAVRLDSPEMIKHRGRCHLLVQPAAWPFPDWLKGIKQSAPLPTG